MSRLCRALGGLFLMMPFLLATALAKGSVTGWPDLNWGADTAKLDRLFGARLDRLDPPWQFGPFEARRSLPDGMLGAIAYRVFFQMNGVNAASGQAGLQQILLERRHAAATPNVFEKTLQFLSRHYGSPNQECLTGRWRTAAGDPAVAEAFWQLAENKMHLSFLNFRSSEILYLDPNKPIDPLVPEADRRIIHPNLMPQRILLRIYPAARRDLDRPLRC
ncbi:MAG: hypothetical protein AAF530_19240 [Pseudomonadota bacterium]